MDVTLDPLANRLLALMYEADAEAVTLDELAVAGIDDPARALRTLELVGFSFERVVDHSAPLGERECVRLARATTPAPATRALDPEPEAAAAPAPEEAPGDLSVTVTLQSPHVPEQAITTVTSAPAQWFGDPNAAAALDPPAAPDPSALAASAAARPLAAVTRRAPALAAAPPASALLEAADQRPMVVSLVALAVAAVVGRTVVSRRG